MTQDEGRYIIVTFQEPADIVRKEMEDWLKDQGFRNRIGPKNKKLPDCTWAKRVIGGSSSASAVLLNVGVHLKSCEIDKFLVSMPPRVYYE